MIENINFPEGTQYKIENIKALDFFSEDYVWPDDKLWFNNIFFEKNIMNGGFTAMRPTITDNITQISYLYYNVPPTAWIPTLNISNVTSLQLSLYNHNGVLPMILTGGSTKLNSLEYVNSLKSVFLEYGYDWTNLKRKLAITTTVYPFGEVLLRLRILKDGVWMAGEEVRYIRPDIDVPMEYLGGGVYGYTVNILPREIHRYLIEIGEDTTRYAVVASDEESILYIGDNSDLQTQISGTYILDYATSNPNNWSYDTTVGGVRSNDINDNQNTYMTLTLPVNTINLQYGQASESGYDYCNIYDGSGNKIIEFKGIKTYDSTVTLTSSDKVFKFEYKKDGSGTYDEDAFWIKSISWESLPPYPNN